MEGVRNYSARNPDIDAMEEDMEIPDKPEKILGMFGFPVARLPCDLKGAADNTNESSTNQIEDDDNIAVVSDEGDSKDVISSIIISRVETVVNEEDYCKTRAKATSPISSTPFVEHETKTETSMDFDNTEDDNGSPISNHLLESYKNEKSKCTICNTFVPVHLREKHLLKCKTRIFCFECNKCKYKTIYEKMFVSHQADCSNKHRSIPHQSEASGDQNRKLEKSEGRRREEINERSKQLHRCEYCSYSTERKYDLKKHILAHTCNRPIYRCSECDYKSTSRSLSCHMRMAHKVKFKEGSLSTEAQQLISCNFCSFTTKYRLHFRKHRQLHTVRNEPIVSCTKCDYKAPRVTLGFHYGVHGSLMNKQEKAKQVYSCKLCSYATEYEDYFENHLLLHTVWSSSLAGSEANSATAIDLDSKRHNVSLIKDEEGEESDKETPAAANVPIFSSSLVEQGAYTATAIDFDNSKSHNVSLMKAEEGEQIDKGSSTTEPSPISPINCSNKRRSIPRPSEASGNQSRKLEKSKQREETNEPSKQLHRCKYCSYSTKTISRFKVHIRAHTVNNSPIYRCPKCDYKSTRQSLTQHMMMAHKIKFKDASLSAETLQSTKISFSEHMKIAHKIESINTSFLAKTKGLRLKKCDFCSYTTKYSGYLKNHRELHTVSNKPIFSCAKCDYKAPYITLGRHYKDVHGSQKDKAEYMCKFCSFTTHVERNLRKHTHLHTVNRPIYRCSKCDYKSTKQELTQHVKATHKFQFKVATSSSATQQLRRCDNDNITTAATFSISFSSLVGQRGDARTSIDLGNSGNHCALSSISDQENEEGDKETPAAENCPIPSSCLGDLETKIDLDKCENHSVLSFVTDREDEESDKENSTDATLPISFYALVGQEANTATAIDLDSKSHIIIKYEENEESDKETPAAAKFPVSSTLVGNQELGEEGDLETSIDLVKCENLSPESEREDEESDKEMINHQS